MACHGTARHRMARHGSAISCRGLGMAWHGILMSRHGSTMAWNGFDEKHVNTRRLKVMVSDLGGHKNSNNKKSNHYASWGRCFLAHQTFTEKMRCFCQCLGEYFWTLSQTTSHTQLVRPITLGHYTAWDAIYESNHTL